MSTTTAELVAPGDDGENITDIQNYLQSFNKEIGEVGGGDGQGGSQTTFYIDASQLTSEGASGTTDTTTTLNAGSASDGYQTLALLPNQSGGYVLIVQPDGVANMSIPDDEDGEPPAPTPVRVTRVKKEAEKANANDISVYDFEQEPGGDQEGGDITNDPEGEYDEDEDVGSEEEVKPKAARKRGMTPKTPVSSAKKAKSVATPSTPNTSGNQHMCNYCNYTSNKRYLLSRHMKSHSEERPHKCGICERGFKTIASLQNHVNTHTGVRPHNCKYCEAAFTTSGELVRHVRYRHTHEKPHRCTECDYASVELSKLKRHMRCHTGERPYQCPHCTYASPDTYKLKRHLRIHTGEKPYECDVCHARFTQSNSLKAHRLIHSGNKPVFRCELCPTTCGRKTDLRIHVQKLHTSEKPMTCRRCDQSFPDRYTFKIHLKSHEGEKCFKCDLCNYASVSARHLESHMLIHTDQKPFQCDECDQSFRQKQLLKRHKNLYHNPEYIPPQPKEKTHECAHCQKSFRHKGNLMRHMAIHDPDAYKDSNTTLRFNDDLTLIDDEDEEEEEESEEEDEDDVDESLDPQTLQFTLDPNSQSILGGDQVVVFEVVQDPGEEGDNGQFEAAVETPKNKFVGKNARRAIKVLNQSNGSNADGTIVLQLQAEDEEAANAITGSIIDDADFEPTASRSTKKSAASGPVPPPIVQEESKNTIQKQREKAQCFGFKDDDEEDDAILSLPASAAQ